MARWRRYWCTYQRRCGNAGPMVFTQGGHPRGRPSQGTAGSILRTGGHQPKDWQALFFNKKRLNELTKLLEADVSEVVCGVLFWCGGLVFLCLFIYSWFLSLLLLRFGLVGGFQHSRGFPLGPGWQRHERSYNFHRSSSVSLRWAGISRFRFATFAAPSVPFGTGVRRESSKASGSRPESCFLPLVYKPLFPGIPDGRLHLDRGSFL